MRKHTGKKPVLKTAVLLSFEEENKADCLRFGRMTPRQRLDEFAILQERVWGARWTKKPMRKIASVETVDWW